MISLNEAQWAEFQKHLFDMEKLVHDEFGDTRCLHMNHVDLSYNQRCPEMCSCGHDCSSHVEIGKYQGFQICCEKGCFCLVFTQIKGADR